VMLPSPAGPVPTPLPAPFSGPPLDGLSGSTFIDDRPAATDGSASQALPPHLPAGGPFQRPPKNRGRVRADTRTVFIDDHPAARHGDRVATCNDPADREVGMVVATATVFVGD